LEEAGGVGAEPLQNLTTAAEVVQTVLPLEWSGRNGNGKNPDGQGFKSGVFFASFAKKYYSSLDGLDRRIGHKTGIAFNGKMCYTLSR